MVKTISFLFTFFAVLQLLNLSTGTPSESSFKCPLLRFLYNGTCVSECPGRFIGDTTDRTCNKAPAESDFSYHKYHPYMDGSDRYVVATNATEYKAVILHSTSTGTEVLTLGIKDFTTGQGQRIWRYRPCRYGNTASFPFRIDTDSFKVTVENTLEDGEYRKCIELYDSNSALILDNMVRISVVSNFATISANLQGKQVGESLVFECSYTLFADNPYLISPFWYLGGHRVVNGSNVNGSLVTTTCDDQNSSIVFHDPSLALTGLTLQCRLESNHIDVNETSNTVTLNLAPKDPIIEPIMNEQLPNHLATFECTHAVGYPVHWNITSNANITPIYENGSDKSNITIRRVSKSMNETSVQCWQTVSGIVLVSEVATLIVTGPPSRVGNLRMTSVSTNNFTLAWDEPFASQKAPVVQFHVLYGPRDCETVTESDIERIILTEAEAKGVTLTDLQDGTVYCVHVFALSFTGQGEAANIQVTTQDIDECAEGRNNCSHICVNTMGSYTCQCRSGFRLRFDGYTCEDINECDDGSSRCSHNCKNTEGSYVCLCPRGYQLGQDGFTCEDIDECAEGRNNCSHICENTMGSYTCQCRSGFHLRLDGYTCEDIDECAEGRNNCSHICENTMGSYTCQCRSGFRLTFDGYTCEDINECDDGSSRCSHNCKNTEGSYVCLCPRGYLLGQDRFTCEDLDECAGGTGSCSHVCKNTVGSYVCSCPTDYKLRQDGFTCEAVVTLEVLDDLITGFANVSLEARLNLSLAIAETLTNLEINTTDGGNVQEIVEAVTNILKEIIKARQEGKNVSSYTPEEEDTLNKNMVSTFGILLSDDVVTSVENDTDPSTPANRSSVVVGVVDTVESLGIVVASSNNTRSNVTYQSGNLTMKVEVERNGTEFEVELDSVMVSVGAQNDTALVVTSYGRVGSALPVEKMDGDVDSKVISLQLADRRKGEAVQPKSPGDEYPVKIEFDDVMHTENSSCRFYKDGKDGTGAVWSSEGVETVNCSSGVCCKSKHLTNFAVLVNVGNVQHNPAIETALLALSYIGCGLSIICLIITIIALIIFRYKGQKTPLNFVHINLSVVLLAALVIFVGASYPLRHEFIPCAIVTGILHYLFLAVFSWMLCEGVMLYLMLVKVFSSLPKKLWFFLMLGYGLPIIPVVVTAGVKHKNYVNRLGCWLSSDIQHGTIWGFAAPVVIIMLINLVFLVLAVVQLCKSQKISSVRETSNRRVALVTAKAAILLLPLLGVTWVFGFITFDVQTESDTAWEVIPLIFQIIFILLNSTQGVMIFVFYVLRNEKVLPLWKKCFAKCCPCCKAELDAATSSKSRTDTVQLGTFTTVSVAGKDELTKVYEPEKKEKDTVSITDLTVNTNNVENGIKVDFGEAQKVAYVFNDVDSATSVPDMEFSVAEPVISSTSEMKRTSPL